MAFNNSELNRARSNWVREATLSEHTDPDYDAKAEQRFLQELLELSDDEVMLALGGYSRPQAERLFEELCKLKRRNNPRAALREIIRVTLISGGQTGADRAALDFAIEHGIEHGGYCPRGRLAEDGSIPERYKLQETTTRAYPQRTELNVSHSDGTVIFTINSQLSGGSKKTLLLAQSHKKPALHLSREGGPAQPEKELRRFIEKNKIKVLNVAGSRASKEPKVADFVKEVLSKALLQVAERP